MYVSSQSNSGSKQTSPPLHNKNQFDQSCTSLKILLIMTQSSTIQPYSMLLSTVFYSPLWLSDISTAVPGMDDNAALTHNGGCEKTTTADWSKQLATWLHSVSIFETCIFRWGFFESSLQVIGANSSPRGCIVSPSSKPTYSGEAFSSLELRPFDNLANTHSFFFKCILRPDHRRLIVLVSTPHSKN